MELKIDFGPGGFEHFDPEANRTTVFERIETYGSSLDECVINARVIGRRDISRSTHPEDAHCIPITFHVEEFGRASERYMVEQIERAYSEALQAEGDL